MRRWKQDLIGIGSLDYFVIKNAPMRESKFGDVIDLNLMLIHKMAAQIIIERGLPIRGKEVRFLRKIIVCTMAEFSQKLGLSVGAIQKWEKAAEARLLPVNEVAVRVLMAEELGLDIPAKFSTLVGVKTTPKRVEISA